MDLRTYTDELPHGGMAALAARLGITPVYLSQLAARQRTGRDGEPREPSPELCVQIELATDRAVRRWDLRPGDWHRIWPELIGTDGAPPVEDPSDAEQAA